MRIVEITDSDDERIDAYAHLTEHQLRNVLDPANARMVCESRLVIESALELGLEPLSLLLDIRHLESMADILRRLPEHTPVYVATRDVLSRITGFEVTRGYLGVFRRPAPRAQEDVLGGARRLAVLEGIVDVSNVGAVFRSASALGIDGVLLAPGCADPYTRRALRTSMGCALRIPWARLGTPWPGSGIGLLHDHGFCCCALALRDDARPLDDPVLKEHERLALFLGTEGAGLSQKAIDACDERVVIPMSHGVDSLNVAAAASVAFWELRRRD